MNLTIDPSHTDNPLEDLQILQMCLTVIDDLIVSNSDLYLATAENQDRFCLLLNVLHTLQAEALSNAWVAWSNRI